MFKNLYIEADSFAIRPFMKDDAKDFYHILNQKEVLQYLPEEPMTIKEIIQILDFFEYSYKNNTKEKIIKYTLAIVDKASSRVIGWCGFGPLEFDPEKLELYYGLAKEYWNKGIATKASRLIMEFYFETLELCSLTAVVKAENKASIRVIEKLGFKFIKVIKGLSEEYSFYEGEHYYEIKREQLGCMRC